MRNVLITILNLILVASFVLLLINLWKTNELVRQNQALQEQLYRLNIQLNYLGQDVGAIQEQLDAQK